MDRNEAITLLQAIKHYLTAGNPVWDVDEIAEACDMGIEALRNEINCVKCVHYTERETPTGIKGVCKMDTAHRGDTISRQSALDALSEAYEDNVLNMWEDIETTIKSLPSAETPTVSEKHQLSEETPTNAPTDLISRQALCHYALNQKDKSITPNDIMRFPSAEPRYMGCHGCVHYDQQQTALICRDCKRYYRDMYEDGE